jgi:isopentenyl diphosphate isomerase/L-lactate dehydrogenase-like FMN-dependent dehydrogenase
MEVYVDGGVRRGADIFKCLALGADFVFIGRGFLYSLIDGEEGIKKAFEILKTELKTTMMLAGTRNIPEITKEYILSNEPYSRL